MGRAARPDIVEVLEKGACGNGDAFSLHQDPAFISTHMVEVLQDDTFGAEV